MAAADAQPSSGDEESIRALVTTFADARNAHDGQAVAGLYAVDGEWISADGRFHVRGRAALARLWSSVDGQVQRTIQAIDLAGPSITVVRVVTQYWEPIGRHHEVFVIVRDNGEWKIRVHQSVD